MKQVKIIIGVCIVSLFFFTIHIFFKVPSNIATFKRYTSPVYKIDKSSIESLQKESNTNSEYSEKELIASVLDMINYGKWQDFLDYIDMDIYYCNFFNHPSEQLILSLNLSKDLGVAVLFEEVNNSYIFHSKIDSLSPIENIQTIPHPTQDRNFLGIYQTVDESLGSFFRESFIQIYEYKESDFNLVWEKTLFYEEIYKENWIDIKAPENSWIMVTEETDIDFDYSNSAKINTITSFKKYGAQSKITPQKNDFVLNESKSFVRSYYWNDRYNTFILGELTKDTFLSDIAVLEDMESNHEWLYGIKNPYYKVSTPKGEIIYLSKSAFGKLFEGVLNEQ